MTSHFIITSVTSKMTSNIVLLSVFVTFLLTGATFFTAGWFSQKPFNNEDSTNYMENTLDTFSIQDDFDAVDKETLYANLKILTEIPHLAGDTRDHILAEFIKDKFNEYGLDHAEIKEYNVLLDYPNKTAPNLITLSNEDGILYESVYQEEGFEDVLKSDDNFIDAYLAYSKAGIAEGKLVYVNYGSKGDFELLANKSSPFYTDVTDKICITRYGQVFRGNKAKNAEVAGCSGLIIFSDPADVAGEGQDPDSDVYPHTMFLPDTGIQRGSLLLTDGDPQTPNWPSLEHTARLSIDELEAQGLLPRIPCQAIGYRGAKELMKYLSGTKVPDDWVGGLSGVEYFIGGDFKAECGECNVRIVTNNILETKQSPNVMGYITGSHEPDRYVMIGNHRDAWGYGALDPSSGTTQMLEIARILGAKLANGWRPRRTIVFLSWGSEEFGLIGSREFVEDFRRKLIERGVVYINSDTAVSGPIMWAEASPTISHKVVEAAKKVQYQNHDSYYDFWKQWLELDDETEPEIWIPGAGSDHASFIFHAGIPVMDFGFGPDTKLHPSVANIGYPTYHTAYETFQLMTDIVDPNFEMLSVSTKITLSIVRDFAENPILDFNLRGYQPTMEAFKTDPEIAQLEKLGIQTEYFLSALDTFQNATESWTERFEQDLEDLQNNPLLAKAINDQMMNLDKNFLLDDGLPGRPLYSHAIMSPSQFDSYGSGYFPGISDTLYDFDSQDQTEQERRKVVLKKHLSDLMIVILRACDHLKPLDRL